MNITPSTISMLDKQTSLLRLLHLVSPSLPIGSFTYSQGIEWAVEYGWVDSPETLQSWLNSELRSTVLHLDLPLLIRFYKATEREDAILLAKWVDYANASRETAELLQEEKNRGRALTDLLIALDMSLAKRWKPLLTQNQSAAFAVAACTWRIPLNDMLHGFLWSWLENMVLSAVKIIPLGQTQGQRLLEQMTPMIADTVKQGFTIVDDDMGASSPALAIASSRHETQYTRIFRS